MNQRLKQQMDFLIEIDRMKSIYRQTILIDQSRSETDAEHSWHIGMMAMILAEYAHSPSVDIQRVIRMVLIHDLVEIYAGDTYAYDDAGNVDRAARETLAAQRLFGILPEDQRAAYHALWAEFEQMESADALYANAVDCIQPIVNNYMTKGVMWQKNHATSDKVMQRMQRIQRGAPEVYTWMKAIVNESVAKGYLPK